MQNTDLQVPYAEHALPGAESPREENPLEEKPLTEVRDQTRAAVRAYDPHADIVLARVGGLQVVHRGLRTKRYRQGV